MALEIELKLALPASAQPALLRHPLLKSAQSRRTETLTSIYYDTPGLRLRKSGMAVRLRRAGRAWLQTVKCAGRSAAGLSARPEWETPYCGRFDFSAIDDAAARRLLEANDIRAALLPVFETRFRRVTWQFDGVRLTLDRGWVAAGGRSEAISELELELTDTGTVAELFALADRLAQRVPLLPAPLSKAERGFRCHLGTADAPTRAGAVALTRDMAPLDAFRHIAFSCLDQMQRNHAGVVASDDPEYIHQLRVATRRLRACFRVFAPILPPGVNDGLSGLRELMRILGAARDLDVLAADVCAPVVAALPDDDDVATLSGHVAEQRLAARRDVVRHLQAPEFGRLMIRLAASLQMPEPAAPTSGGGIATFAAGRLRRLRCKVRARARAGADDPASLHALRIGIKRLRYAQEFFVSFQRRKSHRHRIAWLARTQDLLGTLNDLANAGAQLQCCTGGDPRLQAAMMRIGDWHRERHAKRIGRLPDRLTRLRALA